MVDQFRLFAIQLVRDAAHYDGDEFGRWTLRWATDRRAVNDAAKLIGLKTDGEHFYNEHLRAIEDAAISSGMCGDDR